MSLALCPMPRQTVAREGTEPSAEHRVLACLREACRRLYGKQELAAVAYGVSPGHFARQLAGLEPLRVQQLARCPDILDEFAALLAKARGHRLAPRLTPLAQRRRVEKATHALELARLDLEDALDDAASGASSVAS